MVRRVLRRHFRDDDYDEDGNGPYDRKYPGKRVIADQGRVRVPVMLTDSASRRVPLMDSRSYRLTDRQAAMHRPHEATAVLSDADIRAARSPTEHARAEWIRRMADEWSHPIGGLPRSVPNGEGNGDDEDYDDNGSNGDDRTEAEKARDQWIDRTSRAWSEPWRGAAAGPSPSDRYGKGNDPARAANAVERQRRGWTAEDAAADKEAAYREYCVRVSNAWKW
jgi:hypothetical protein